MKSGRKRGDGLVLRLGWFWLSVIASLGLLPGATVDVAWPFSAGPLPYEIAGSGVTLRGPAGDAKGAQTINGQASPWLSRVNSSGNDVLEVKFEMAVARTVRLHWIYVRSPQLGNGSWPSAVELDGTVLVSGLEGRSPPSIAAPDSYTLSTGFAVPPGTPMTELNAKSLAPVYPFPGGGLGGDLGHLTFTLSLAAGVHTLRFSEGSWLDNGMHYRAETQNVRLEVLVGPPELSVTIKNMRSLQVGISEVSADTGDPYLLEWTSTGADAVSIVGAPDGYSDLSAALNGSHLFSSGQVKAGDYRYTVRASNLAGVSEAQVVVHVRAQNVLLFDRRSSPVASISPAVQEMVLGGTATIELAGDVNENSPEGAMLTGPGVALPDPANSVAVTPNRTGTLSYQYQTIGYTRLRWRGEGASRFMLHHPDGHVEEVTSLLYYDAQVPGDYFVTATDDAGGNGVDSGIARVGAPPTASALAQVRVNPRIDRFAAESPPAPSASITPAGTVKALFGDPVNAVLAADFEGGSVFEGSGIRLVDTDGAASFTSLASGRQVYRFSVSPLQLGVLRWDVAGATSVEIDGVVRAGNEWTSAPAGLHTLRALGPDGTETLAPPVSIVVPSAAQAEFTVEVYPKINDFVAANPAAPSLSLALSPAVGLVNPAKADLTWSTAAARSLTLVATGRGSEWTRTELTGSASLVLGPGLHTFRGEAQRLDTLLSWSVAGAESLALIDPAGTSLDVTGLPGPRVATLAGSYRLRAVGNDGLVTESGPQEVVFAAPAVQQVEATVDVTLTVASDKEGRGEGGGVKPYGSLATATAVPNRGYHFSFWSGDSNETRSAVDFTMTEDRTVTAHYEPNLYRVTVTERPAGTGTIEGSGVYPFGTDIVVRASPRRYFEFLGWDGSWSGGVNPRSLAVENDVTAIADFRRIQFRLDVTLSGAGRGTVTPASGRYDSESELVLEARPDAVSRFMAWGGDLSGTSKVVSLSMLRDFSVTALFEPKLAQTITFLNPGDQELNKGSAVNATTTSGLPVRYVVVSGPGELSGGQVFVRGSGIITVRAEQDGDDTYLPAAPVDVSFQGYNPPVLRLREEGSDVRLENSQHRNPNKVLP